LTSKVDVRELDVLFLIVLTLLFVTIIISTTEADQILQGKYPVVVDSHELIAQVTQRYWPASI
jgi:hypothetical protein